MSILIKGVKMPKNCEECQSTLGLFVDECPIFAEFPKMSDYDPEIGNNRRYDGCPLVEIPPHGRLIDASEMAIKFSCLDLDITAIKNFHELLMEIPTVIESEE